MQADLATGEAAPDETQRQATLRMGAMRDFLAIAMAMGEAAPRSTRGCDLLECVARAEIMGAPRSQTNG